MSPKRGESKVAGKHSGTHGKVECRSSQRLPGGVVSEGAKHGATQPSGGGTKSKDAADTKARPNQSLPEGFNNGGQGDYPHGPLTHHNCGGVHSAPSQHLPGGHWGDDNVSQGKGKGAVRGADAYQGPRKEQSDPTPRKPGQ